MVMVCCGLMGAPAAAATAAARQAAESISEQIAQARRLFDEGRSPRAAALFEEAARRAEQQQRGDDQAWALLGLARATTDRDHRSEAKAIFERALRLFAENRNRAGRAQALAASGVNLFVLGDREEGRRRVVEACETLRALGETETDALVEASVWLLVVMDAGPEKDRARDEALALARASHVPEHACSIQVTWGNEQFAAGDLGRAYRTFTDAVNCYEALPAPRQARSWRALVSLGDIERAHGQFDAALAAYQRALDVARRVDNPVAIIASLNGVGVGHRALRQMPEARAAYEEALARASGICRSAR